jgi:hypothetical protein
VTRQGLAVYLALAFLIALVSAKVRVPVSYLGRSATLMVTSFSPVISNSNPPVAATTARSGIMPATRQNGTLTVI